MNEKKDGLKREIGVLGLSANIINIIVGAGIFVLPAIIAEGLGSSSLIAYLCCGALISLIMLCFAEVGSKITGTGGAYAYIEAAFGKYSGFLTAMLFISASITADAAVANALLDILSTLHPIFLNNGMKLLFFILLFFGLAYVNIIGVKQGIGLIKILTALKLLPLLLLVGIGLPEISMGDLNVFQSVPITRLGEMCLILFFAFQGGEIGLIISGEVKQPNRTIPRAIFIGVTIVLLLYISIQLVAQGALGSALAQYKEAPLAQTFLQLIGPIGFLIMTIGAAVSMFGNLSGEILSVPRIIFSTAKDRVIPIKALSAIHPKYHTPHIAILLYASLGCIGALLGGFKQLAILSSASALLIYFGVAAAVIKLRKHHYPNAFTIPFGKLIPILAIAVTLWLLTNLSTEEQLGMLLFLSIVSGGYWIIKYLNNRTR